VALALERAAAAVNPSGDPLEAPELIALELRAALESLRSRTCETVDEAVLGRIFARFCVGK
jgi:tRNA modification GTPase trmE